MHRHSSDSTNAVIQFIQNGKYVLKILLNGQSVGGDIYLCVPQRKCWGDVSPRLPHNRRPCPSAAGRAQDRESSPVKRQTFYHCAAPPTITLNTLEQFTISEAEIFRYSTNKCKGTKTKTSYFTKKNTNSVDLFIINPVDLLSYGFTSHATRNNQRERAV